MSLRGYVTALENENKMLRELCDNARDARA